MDNPDNNLTYVLVDKSLSNDDSHSKTEEIIKDDVSFTDVNYYISVALLSVIGYIIIAYSSNVSLMELVDLEIPLILALSVVIVFLSNNWSRLLTYILVIVSICIIIGLNFNYSFFLMIILFSELCIYSINKIVNNKDDYQLDYELD